MVRKGGLPWGGRDGSGASPVGSSEYSLVPPQCRDSQDRTGPQGLLGLYGLMWFLSPSPGAIMSFSAS